MQPKRFSVKYFVQGDISFDPAVLVTIFQRWIQEHTVEGLLIDVADYKHIHNGPGIVLLGHEGDYSFSFSGGRPGLVYTRKRELQTSFAEDLRVAMRLAVSACKKLEEEIDLNGVQFNYDDVEITFLDRLNTPNTPEIFESIRDHLQGLAAELLQTEAVRIESVEPDPRKNLTVRLATSQVNVAG